MPLNAAEEHDRQILEQFTLQARPFVEMPSHSTEESLRVLLETAGVTGDDEVLDVACGPGIVACAMAEIARRVTGVDMVPAMLDEARKLQADRRLANLEWHLGDAARLPFPDQTFSLVVTRYSFHHLLEPVSALREMKRVCRVGGRVVVADETPEPGEAAAFNVLEQLRDPSHTRALTLGELQTVGTAESLSLIATAGYLLEVDVDELLGNSFPPPGNAARFREAVRADIGLNRLSIGAYEKSGSLRFRFPISVIAWRREN